MPNSQSFEWTSTALEAATSLDRLEARGTLRLALKASGLDPRDVSAVQMQIVMQRVLPPELEARGVSDPVSLCDRLAREMPKELVTDGADSESPENIFARLGGS